MAGNLIERTVSGADERTAVEAGLRVVLRLARGGTGEANEPDEHEPGETAVPIRGQGGALGRVFFALADDLLAQLENHGVGLRAVRLDGLLRTEDGYTGWGYLVGATGDGTPPRTMTLADPPHVERAGEGLTLRLRLAVE